MSDFIIRPCWHIGITGGIGSGKSTVTAIFKTAGACVIDTDKLARNSTSAGGLAVERIRSAFGNAFIDADGAMNRTAMRNLIFQDPAAKSRLECIIHPIVQQQAQTLAAEAERQGSNAIIYEIPLLTESNHWRKRLHAIVVVDCDIPTQVQRTMQRNHLDRASVEAIIANQASRAQRWQIADAVLDNGAAIHLPQLQKQVHALARNFGLMITPKEAPSDPVRIPLQ